MKMAYLANVFPSPVEQYVAEEIEELRRRGVVVLPCSALRPKGNVSQPLQSWAQQTLYLQPLRRRALLDAVGLCWQERHALWNIVKRALTAPGEPTLRRLKMLAHTVLGAYLGALLAPLGIQHIHVHHGYFSSWIAMVAARVLGITYSMTLHGSDILLHHAFLDLKLETCAAAFTVSEFNRKHLCKYYPEQAHKVVLRRLGTSIVPAGPRRSASKSDLILLTAGRLHPVKDHMFLVNACAALKTCGLSFLCLMAGDGPERRRLQRRINSFGLQDDVKLLGHIPHDLLLRMFAVADLFVLTSKSEGIPLVLMEAMAAGVPVLAPHITGIPELVIPGQTGFLYTRGSLHDFVDQIHAIRKSSDGMTDVCRAARQHVALHYNNRTNVSNFADQLLQLPLARSDVTHEDPVLQQVQLSFQRH
jgi:colanic acid/amylovoran biosynthesis glycosyltransferase